MKNVIDTELNNEDIVTDETYNTYTHLKKDSSMIVEDNFHYRIKRTKGSDEQPEYDNTSRCESRQSDSSVCSSCAIWD